MAKKLYRSRTDRMIWGVCGGLASYFDVDPTIVRIAAVLSIFASGWGVLAYLIMAVVVPLESSTATEPKEVIKENVEEIKATATEFGQQVQSTFAGRESTRVDRSEGPGRTLRVMAIVLILIGIIFLLDNLRMFWWLRLTFLWPFILIAIGLLILLRPRRR